MAEERLHDLRPAAMMRYDDLRSQGLDPVTAMRQVVPLLETDPRIGEPGLRAGALAATSTSTKLDDLNDFKDARAADLDAGRLPDDAATRVLRNALDEERDVYEPPRGLKGCERTHSVADRMADSPYLGWDDRDTDQLHEDLAASNTELEPAIANPRPDAPFRFNALRPVDVVAAALLVSDSALLTDIEAHRTAAAQHGHLAAPEQITARDLAATPEDRRTPIVDEHAQALSATDSHLSAVTDASARATFERTAEQALTASFPTPVTEVPAAAVAAAANAPVAVAQASGVTTAAPRPTLVRS